MELVIVLVLLPIFFIPTINAFVFNHKYKVAIFILNLVLGPTGFGWFLVLFWSWAKNPDIHAEAIAPMTEKFPLSGLLRAKIASLRERQDETRAEFVQKMERLDAEIADLEALARSKDAAGWLEPTSERAGAPAFETVARPAETIIETPAPVPTPVSAEADTKPVEPAAPPLPAVVAPESELIVPAEEAPIEAPQLAPTLESLAPPATEAPAPTEPEPQAPIEPPTTAVAEATAPARPRIDWEALIGGSWLNIVGIVVLVVGIALLTEHTLREFGPLGRILTAAAVGATLLVGGLVLERIEARYRIFARTLMGGGWAVLYFTAYAAHNVEAARVIDNPATGLATMMGVAAAMILHSLAFRSQLVTGLAYGLAFFAVGLTPVTLQSLIACAILAASQVALLRILDWRTLALVAVAGVYLNHWRWIDAVTTASRQTGAHPLDYSSYWLSLAIIGFYWALMAIASLSHPEVGPRDRLIQLTISVANTIGMLGVAYLQIAAFDDRDLYLLAGAAAAAYACAAFASWRLSRQDLYRFNIAVAGVLYAAALPLALEPLAIDARWLSVYWLVGGFLAVAVGVALRELLTRIEGYLLCGVAVWATVALVLPTALDDWRSAVWWMAPGAALGLLALSEVLLRAAAKGAISRVEGESFGPLGGYVASILAIVFAQKVAAPEVLGPILAAAGVALFETGADGARLHLRAQAYLIFVVAALQTATVNLAPDAPSSLLLAAPAIFTQFYVFWRMRTRTAAADPVDWIGAQGLCVAATGLIALLLWRRLDPALVALAWLPLSALLFELGARLRLPTLRAQAYGLAAASLAALCVYDLAEVPPGPSRWLIVSSGSAFFYYYYLRLAAVAGAEGDWRSEIERENADVFSFAGAALLAALAWREIDPSIVALVWLAFAGALIEIGLRARRTGLRVEAYLLAALAFLDFLRIGLEPAAVGHFAEPRLILPLAALMYYVLFTVLLAARDRGLIASAEAPVADLPSFAGSALIAILIWRAAHPSLIAPAWLALALALLETGVATKRDALRPQAYLLFACALVALGAINLYELYPTNVAITAVAPSWLIVGGGALVYYYLFWRLRASQIQPLASPAARFLADATSLVGTALLAVLIWKDSGFSSVALGWAALGLALYEIGRARHFSQLARQGHVMALLAFGRCFIANFIDLTTGPLGLSHRLLSVTPIIALFYVLRAETLDDARAPDAASGVFAPARLARLYSWGAALLIVALLRFELGRADWIMGVAPVLFALFVVGETLDDVNFRYQSYVMAVLGVARVFVTNVYLTGEFYALGLPERLVTLLPLLVSLISCAGVALRRPRPQDQAPARSRFTRALQACDHKADEVFAFLAAVIGLVLVYCEAPEGWVTSIWALEALVLIVAGFAASKRSFRYWGLFILFVCVLKLVVLDLSGVETIYRNLSYIALGLILLAASFVYTLHRKVFQKYM